MVQLKEQIKYKGNDECYSLSPDLRSNMWGEGVSACYILNRILYKEVGKTDFEFWKDYAPKLTILMW